METRSIPVLMGVFVIAAVLVWIAGNHLMDSTDGIDRHFGLGDAFGGLVLLAIATNLPEIAITVTAALRGNLDLAVGNLLGGVAVQTVVLVVLDIALSRTRREAPPLSTLTSSVVSMLEAGTVIAVLAVVLIGSQVPGTTIFHVDPVTVVIALTWIAGLAVVYRANRNPAWAPRADPSDAQGAADDPEPGDQPSRPIGTLLGTFGLAALVTLVGGAALERSGSALATATGVDGIIFGATVLAVATSIPEISTGIASIVRGDAALAVSDVLGGNAVLPVLLLVASAISGTAVVHDVGSANVYLAGLGGLLTAIYLIGMWRKSRNRVWDMGLDSLAVLIVYGAGLVGLAVIVAA